MTSESYLTKVYKCRLPTPVTKQFDFLGGRITWLIKLKPFSFLGWKPADQCSTHKELSVKVLAGAGGVPEQLTSLRTGLELRGLRAPTKKAEPDPLGNILFRA